MSWTCCEKGWAPESWNRMGKGNRWTGADCEGLCRPLKSLVLLFMPQGECVGGWDSEQGRVTM